METTRINNYTDNYLYFNGKNFSVQKTMKPLYMGDNSVIYNLKNDKEL